MLDRIQHPSGETGLVVLNDSFEDDFDKWLVRYGKEVTGFSTPFFSRLILQIGEKGRAVVISSPCRASTEWKEAGQEKSQEAQP